MDFEFTEDQELLRAHGARVRRDRDRAPRDAASTRRRSFRARSCDKPAELGLLGILFPEEYGGAGLGYLEYAIVVEELSRVDGSVGHLGRRAQRPVLRTTSTCAAPRSSAASTSSRWRAGAAIGGWSLTEPTAGSDAGGHAHDRAARRGRAGSSTASKTFTHARLGGRRDRRLRRDRPERGQARDLGLRRREAARPGFRPGKKENKMGLRASDTAEVVMEDCRVPARPAARVSAAQGFIDAMKILDGGRISIAALALGHGARGVRGGAELRRSSASSSASRSPSSRRSSSCSPTWRRRSTRRRCWSIARRG